MSFAERSRSIWGNPHLHGRKEIAIKGDDMDARVEYKLYSLGQHARNK
jgi:hypothetical protein